MSLEYTYLQTLAEVGTILVPEISKCQGRQTSVERGYLQSPRYGSEDLCISSKNRLLEKSQSLDLHFNGNIHCLSTVSKTSLYFSFHLLTNPFFLFTDWT